MESTESQIRSFKPFAGALLFSMAVHNEVSLFKRARSHPPGIGCCPLHVAATLPGGDDAQWILEYANSPSFSFSNDRVPVLGVDSRIDLWTMWDSRRERMKRLESSISSGNTYAIDEASYFAPSLTRGIDPLEENVFDTLKEQLFKLNAMSLDQLERLASRGSETATKMLVFKLARSGEESGRFVFWAFIYYSIHKGNVSDLLEETSRVLETKIGKFQLGKCFADAAGGGWFDNNYACSAICFNKFSVPVESLLAKSSYYIDEYKNAEERARAVINLWSIGMMKQGLIYDVRHMIVKLLWDARWTWVPEWKSMERLKRLKLLYAEAGTGHEPLPSVN